MNFAKAKLVSLFSLSNQKDIAVNQYLETHAQFDNFGNARKAWDARGNVSEVEYSATYKYAYPTKTISAVPDPSGASGSNTAFETISVYDLNTGLVTSTTDSNGQIRGKPNIAVTKCKVNDSYISERQFIIYSL